MATEQQHTTDDLPSGDDFSPEGQAEIDRIISEVRADTEQRQTTRTPYPPGRICPECGSPVSRHDGLLFCIPRVGCPRDELRKWDRELLVQMAAEGDEECIAALAKESNND